LIFAQYKVFGAQFTLHGGFQYWINKFLAEGGAYPFMAPVLRNFVLPHATPIAFLVAYGELAIGISLVSGVLVRPASLGGLVYMLTLLLSSNYPGAHAAFWQYFGASLSHSVFAVCFAAFLIGQPELRLTLQGPDMQQFRQRVIASYHLSRLEPLETQAYIQHRLRQVGWVADPKLEDEAYNAIFAFTEGIPRRINLVCNRLLLAGFLNEKHVLDAADVETVGREMTEELGVVGRPDEPAEKSEEGPEPDVEAGQAVDPQIKWDLPLEEIEHVARPMDDARTDASELLGRIARLEKAVTRVLTMLRRRSG
jgi:thiosulfate dehydrogenase [quinone] large subunit